jgi:hypothetical protein
MGGRCGGSASRFEHSDGGAAGRAVRMTPMPAKLPKQRTQRQEGWDERLMVRFAFFLAVVCAALGVYATVTWAAG